MKSTAKAEALLRDLKDRLEFRGFEVAESKDAQGWPKLTLNTNEASIRMEVADAVSKDVFGNDLKAFAPHAIEVASRADAIDVVAHSKILLEVVKMGTEKTIIKTDASDLAAAEATAGEAIGFDVTWPTKGI